MNIVGGPSAAWDKVISNLPVAASVGFREHMFPALWAAASAHGIDPVGMIAQSGKETGWGTFRGQVRPEFHNTCGLKVSAQQMKLFPGVTDGDNPLAHAMFASWDVGAWAHAQHLCAYAGHPVRGLIVDPRYNLVTKGVAKTWGALGTRWAPSATYGEEIAAMVRELAS